MGIQKMSIEQMRPVVMKKAQLGTDQCGLSSIVPMSCRGRAEAFARRLHTRLRSLGTSEATASATPSINNQDLYYEFDLECDGPSSPAEEADAERNSNCHHDSDCDSLYLDAEDGEAFPANQSTKLANFAKYNRLYDGALLNNNTKTTTNRNEDNTRKTQHLKENGHADKKLFSPICLDGCAFRNSPPDVNGIDEVDRGWSQIIPTVVSPDVHQTDIIPLSIQHQESLSVKEQSPVVLPVIVNGYKDNKINNDLLEISLETSKEQKENEILIETKESNDCAKEVIDEAPTIIVKEQSTENESKDPEHLDDGKVEQICRQNSSEEETETDEKPQHVRRCSSLKTGKTPPGTPGRKKIVRFADVLGLDLADVKTFIDDIPTIPKSAYLDLLDVDISTPPPAYPANGTRKPVDKYIVPMFQSPCLLPNFIDILNEKYVCLEKATVNEGTPITVSGSVRVRNIDFHKSVHIRYSMNNWKTYSDVQAIYVQGTCDGFSDKFRFTVYAPTINVGQKLEFAVRFQVKGCQYWDNNSGINYCFQCLPFIGNSSVNTIAPPLTVHPMENWHPSFY